MRVLATHPGRHGDLLWALATVRAVSETLNTKVDVLTSGKYGSLQPLINEQPYVRVCYVLADWPIEESAPISPRIPPVCPVADYDLVLHLGYEGWPKPDLAWDVWQRAAEHVAGLWPLDLLRPWLSVAEQFSCTDVVVGFTDEWFELKVGVYQLLTRYPQQRIYRSVCGIPGSRWRGEAGHGRPLGRDLEGFSVNNDLLSWEHAARVIANSLLFLGDCSALHVLAVGLGVPVICLEPNPQRHNDVFYPCGKTGPQVTLLLGGDGLPTHDARHAADAILEALK